MHVCVHACMCIVHMCVYAWKGERSGRERSAKVGEGGEEVKGEKRGGEGRKNGSSFS